MTIRIYKPSAEEEAEINQRVAAKMLTAGITGSQCAACPKILEAGEMETKGYASAVELGLCWKCGSHVNTKEDITAAEKAGHLVQAKPITIPAKGSGDGGAAYREGEHA